MAILAALYLAALLALNQNTALDQRAEKAAMAAAADYLCLHLNADGRFQYRVHLDGRPANRSYNVLRHAGTIYGLALYHDVSPEPRTRQAILNATRYLLQNHVRPVTNQTAMCAVFSLPGEEIKGPRAQIKLGGCALGLIALIKARELDGGIVEPRILRELGNFILFMQEGNGHFRSKYDEVSLFHEGFDSVYYPGEAILALALLHRIDPDPRWMEAALKGIRYLEESRRGLPNFCLPNDHWLMIAAAALLPQWEPAHEKIISRQRLIDHVLAIGRMMIGEQQRTSWIPGINGAFTPDGSVTPSATRVEGLVALIQILPPDHGHKAEVLRSIEKGLGYIVRAQIREGKARGGFTGDWAVLPWSTQRNVRIDYVQHALSALTGHYDQAALTKER